MIELNVRIFAAEEATLFSFEEASRRLEALPRMFLEPDGAFLWRCEESSVSYQLEGTLIDRGETLYFIELSGSCSSAMLADYLAAIAEPQTPLRVESLITGEAVSLPSH